MHNPFIKVLLPLAAIIIVILLTKYKFHYSFKEDLQIRPPLFFPMVLWILISIAWMMVTDYLFNWRGPWDFTTWKAQPLYVSAIRVTAVCFLGPVAEELIFRGIMFRRLERLKKFPQWLIIIILAAGWALLHYSYSPEVIGIIFIDGILSGAALLHTRSLIVPIMMHISWNLYAIW